MTIALIVALLLTVAAFIVLLDRKDKRTHAEREDFRRDMQLMATRIQDPQMAVAQSITDHYPELSPVPEATPELEPEAQALWPG